MSVSIEQIWNIVASRPKFVFSPTFIFCSPICSNNCGVVFLWKYILVFEKWLFSFDRSNMQIFTVEITQLLPSHVSWISLERLTFSKIYLEFDRFWRVWFRRTDKVSFKSSCFLDWNVMFAKFASINKIKLIYMAVIFVFCWVP